MSTPSRFIAESLEELLVSIADGVREAQDALNSAPPLDRFGRPLPSYHLPYLDFQLQATMETVSSNSGAVRLRIIPLNGSNTATQEISSTLSGRLVAVPPGEGLPTPILSLSSTRENARRHTIRVTASNSAGEILVGQTIELNLNMEASKQLSLIQGITLTSQRAGTRLADALLVTDATGSAETRFDIDPGIPAKAVLVVSAELGSEGRPSEPAGGRWRMKVIEAFARILSDEGADAVGVTVNLEVYVLSSRRWVRLASAKSAAKGIWQAKATRLRSGAFYAPMLRLTEAGNPAPRVLAQSGKLSYNATSQVLSVDFGQVERLAETAYPLSASNSRFSRIQHTVAGQAKRAEVSSATLMRNIALASNINLSRTTAASTGNATVATGNTTLLDTYNAEVLKLRSNEAKLQSQLSQKDQLLATRQQDLSKASSRIAELESTLAKSLANEAKLKEENASFSAAASHKAPIQDIAANIGAEVDAANRRLHDAQHGYRFGKIELDLRGSGSDDGQSMALASLVDLSRLSAGVALPGVKLELLPKRERPITSDNVKVPDVSGLTETAVRRLLQAAGLRLEPVSKSLGPKPKIPVGQAIQQSPKAGAEIARGERVLVVFATP